MVEAAGLQENMTKVQELLDRRADGWESDSEEAGEGLYYTEKQTRVFKAIVRNRDANLKEVADEAEVHPSYVRYIVNRLPKKHANDIEWLMDKAGLTEEELKVENGEPPALSEEEAQAREEDEEEESTGKQEREAVMDSFNVGGGEEEETERHSTEDGYTVKTTRMLPVEIEVTIPQDALEEEVLGATQKAQKAEKALEQVKSD